MDPLKCNSREDFDKVCHNLDYYGKSGHEIIRVDGRGFPAGTGPKSCWCTRVIQWIKRLIYCKKHPITLVSSQLCLFFEKNKDFIRLVHLPLLGKVGILHEKSFKYSSGDRSSIDMHDGLNKEVRSKYDHLNKLENEFEGKIAEANRNVEHTRVVLKETESKCKDIVEETRKKTETECQLMLGRTQAECAAEAKVAALGRAKDLEEARKTAQQIVNDSLVLASAKQKEAEQASAKAKGIISRATEFEEKRRAALKSDVDLANQQRTDLITATTAALKQEKAQILLDFQRTLEQRSSDLRQLKSEMAQLEGIRANVESRPAIIVCDGGTLYVPLVLLKDIPIIEKLITWNKRLAQVVAQHPKFTIARSEEEQAKIDAAWRAKGIEVIAPDLQKKVVLGELPKLAEDDQKPKDGGGDVKVAAAGKELDSDLIIKMRLFAVMDRTQNIFEQNAAAGIKQRQAEAGAKEIDLKENNVRVAQDIPDEFQLALPLDFDLDDASSVAKLEESCKEGVVIDFRDHSVILVHLLIQLIRNPTKLLKLVKPLEILTFIKFVEYLLGNESVHYRNIVKFLDSVEFCVEVLNYPGNLQKQIVNGKTLPDYALDKIVEKFSDFACLKGKNLVSVEVMKRIISKINKPEDIQLVSELIMSWTDHQSTLLKKSQLTIVNEGDPSIIMILRRYLNSSVIRNILTNLAEENERKELSEVLNTELQSYNDVSVKGTKVVWTISNINDFIYFKDITVASKEFFVEGKKYVCSIETYEKDDQNKIYLNVTSFEEELFDVGFQVGSNGILESSRALKENNNNEHHNQLKDGCRTIYTSFHVENCVAAHINEGKLIVEFIIERRKK